MVNDYDEAKEEKIWGAYTAFMALLVMLLGLVAMSVMCSWASFSAKSQLYEYAYKISNIVKIIQAIVAWFN